MEVRETERYTDAERHGKQRDKEKDECFIYL